MELAIITFIRAHWGWVILGAILLLLLIVGIFSKACGSNPKLNEKQIHEAQKAIAEQDRKKMTEILAESDLSEKRIDANLANSEMQTVKTLQEAREKRANATNEQLAAELERRAQP